MIHVFYGEDEFTLHEALSEIKRSLDADGMLSSNTTELDARGLQPQDIIAPASTVPFLGSARLIVVDGLLSRFESRQPSGERRDKREAIGPWKSLATALEAIPESTTLVFVDGRLSPGNALLRLMEPLAEVRQFPGLRQRDVPDWVRRRAQEMGLRLTPAAVALLADLIGNDLRALAQELAKLGMYAQERPIEEEDVRVLVSSAREASVLGMVDAVVEGKTGAAIRLLEQLQGEGLAPTYLLAMITRQYRHLIVAKELLLARLSPAEIGRRLEIRSDFALRKLLEQAARYSLAQLEAAYHRLAETDAQIKRGVYREEVALDLLLDELAKVSSVRR